jgi:glycolate oxidase
MEFKKITKDDIYAFETILDIPLLHTNHDYLKEFSTDHTEDLAFMPEVVLQPKTVEQIAAIMQYCNANKICVTPRGAGTGLSGGALPIYGGVVLSMHYFNKIIDIDANNFQAIIEPGVINEQLQQAVIEHGLFYPPDPASKGSCMIGGNVALSSGGPRALKYGTTRDYILNLQVVLPNGEITWTGANTLKYSTGYNLTHLMIGSEGTLAIITKIVLKLITHPIKNILILASFTSAEDACAAVAKLFIAGCKPSVCEFVEPEGFRLSSNYTNLNFIIAENTGAYLLIEADGNQEPEIRNEIEKIAVVLYENNCTDIVLADDAAKKEYFWKLRRTIGESTKHNNVYKEEDTVVPRAYLPQLYNGVKKIGDKYKVRTICYGHAGDGNLHVNILKDAHTDAFWNTTVKEAIAEIFALCKQLGGTISGEHGIGLVQKEYMPIVLQQANIELMRGIKKVFDPNGILNPGKIF